MACVRALLAVICAVVCVGAGSAQASGSGSGRVYEMRFSAYCLGARKIPRVAPHVLGALAQVTVPAAWHTIHVPPNASASGGNCGQPYLLTDRHGDGNECVQETVYATVAPGGSETPAAFLDEAAGSVIAVIARGALPTESGMRGVWAELAVGSTPAYPTYGVSAAYEAANHKVFYELSVVPPFVESHCPAGSGSLARGIARQLARSFRVDVTDPATAQTQS
jgi:hypothetical protein